MENNKCECKLSKIKKELLNLKNEGGNALMALQLVQDTLGYICEETINAIAQIFEMFPEEIYSTASFYSQFKLQKTGKHTISICLGTACFVLGAENVLQEFEKCLNIKEGETTPDGEFSLDTIRCVGCCALAPVVTVDGKVYAKVKVSEVKNIIEQTKKGAVC